MAATFRITARQSWSATQIIDGITLVHKLIMVTQPELSRRLP